jgi:hypothetical protein
MKNFKNKLLIGSVIYFSVLGFYDGIQVEEQDSSKWLCEGYCFLGGDVPTNPWQPVSATGATEQEARDNIDCGPYEETGISCRMIEEN